VGWACHQTCCGGRFVGGFVFVCFFCFFFFLGVLGLFGFVFWFFVCGPLARPHKKEHPENQKNPALHRLFAFLSAHPLLLTPVVLRTRYLHTLSSAAALAAPALRLSSSRGSSFLPDTAHTTLRGLLFWGPGGFPGYALFIGLWLGAFGCWGCCCLLRVLGLGLGSLVARKRSLEVGFSMLEFLSRLEGRLIPWCAWLGWGGDLYGCLSAVRSVSSPGSPCCVRQ